MTDLYIAVRFEAGAATGRKVLINRPILSYWRMDQKWNTFSHSSRSSTASRCMGAVLRTGENELS